MTPETDYQRQALLAELEQVTEDNDRLTAQNAELLAERESLKKSLRIAEMKNAGSLANNLCPDHRDKQSGKPCLACTVETRERQNAELLAAHEELRCEFIIATLGETPNDAVGYHCEWCEMNWFDEPEEHAPDCPTRPIRP